MRLSRRVYLSLVLVGVSAILSVIVYATVSQMFPAVTVPPLTFATTQNCSTLHLQNAPTAGLGTMIANCMSGTSTVAAFTVNRDGSSTPTFTITASSGITQTSLGIDADGSGCAPATSITTLTSGIAVSFTGAASYIYCLTYTATNTGGTISQFTVNWSP